MIKKWFPVLEHMNIPNAISLAGLSLSISSLYFLLAGNLKVACIMAYLGGILDGIDGAVAHKLNQQSALGAELDSLCDAISFNVVPLLFGALVVRRSPLMWICGLIYCLCGVLAPGLLQYDLRGGGRVLHRRAHHHRHHLRRLRGLAVRDIPLDPALAARPLLSVDGRAHDQQDPLQKDQRAEDRLWRSRLVLLITVIIF